VAENLAYFMPTWLAYLVAGLVHVFLLINVVAVGALVFIWLERKVAGRIQDRLGPTRAGGKFGWLQTLADGIKLIAKEDTMPRGADPLLFRMAPYVSFCAAFAAYMVLPFSHGWVALSTSISAFLILAILGLEVFGVILAGYASGSKWSLFGGMREAAQVVSYEVPLGLCVVVPLLICGTLDLTAVAEMQRGWFTNWLVFHDPFTFIVFWVYVTCATASVNRAPFDLAEAESELVAGFHTEYSGLRWSFFFMAEYGSMFTVSGLAAILFLGGWNGPIPITDMLGLSYQSATDSWSLGGYVANLLGMANFMLKAVLGVLFMMWIRWTLPRLRIDQVMRTCLKYCFPIACFCFLGATVWTLAFPGGLLLKTGKPLGAVREKPHQPVVIPTATPTGPSVASSAPHAPRQPGPLPLDVGDTVADEVAAPLAPVTRPLQRQAAHAASPQGGAGVPPSSGAEAIAAARGTHLAATHQGEGN
jgi:NADH-quinone oxidoreductase subunit H